MGNASKVDATTRRMLTFVPRACLFNSCAREEYPGVNSRVSAAVPWIDNLICCWSSVPPSGCNCDPDSGGSGGGGSGGDGSFCFSGDSKVQVQEKGEVSMSELQIGDKVLTSNSEWESVYAFAHRNDNILVSFLILFVESGNERDSVEISAKHMVYVHGRTHPVTADSIQVGDTLVGRDNAKFVVTKIGQRRSQGIYAPLTPSGKIIVNSVVASNYVSLQNNSPEYVQVGGIPIMLSQHDMSHMWMAPFRVFCRSSASESVESCRSTDGDGISPWAAVGLKFAHWGQSQTILVQVPLLIVAILAIALFTLVEVVMGLPITTLLLLGSGGLVSYWTIKAFTNDMEKECISARDDMLYSKCAQRILKSA
jgi:Hint module